MGKNVDLTNIYKTITETIEDQILVCDPEGQVVFSNPAMQAYLNYSDPELKQMSFFDLIADSHFSKAKSSMNHVSEEPSCGEEYLLHGRHDIRKLYLSFFRKDGLIYIYGNEKYAEYERIKYKLDVEIANAIRIHRRALPASLPETEHISFASLYIPAEQLGGDLFDAFKVDNGLLNDHFEQYVCMIADVSGHGLDSAMLSIFVKDTIRSFFRLKHIPGQVLSPKEIMHYFVEQYKKEGYPDEYLVCLFLSVFDLKTNELTYCNAGLHKCPLLVRDAENLTELNKAGLPISSAIDDKWLKYEDSSVQLFPGMTLFLMSDGLPEQRSNREFYEERLKTLIPEIYDMKSTHIIRRIHKDFTDFLGFEKIKDDITLVVVKLLQAPI